MERGKYDRTQSAAARKKEQRRLLLAAATSVFAQKGFAACAVEDIVREAGISRRTFYEHFDDLEAALAAVHDAAGKFAMRYVEDAVRGAHAAGNTNADDNGSANRDDDDAGSGGRVLTPADVLRGVSFDGEALERGIRALLELVSQNPGLARVLFVEARTAGARLEARMERVRAHFGAVLAGVLGIHADDVRVIALIAGVEAVGAHMASSGKPSLEVAAARMVALARAAAAPDSRDPPAAATKPAAADDPSTTSHRRRGKR